MDMAFPQVLLLGILVGLVVVLDQRVVVRVTMGRRQMLPGGPVLLVVDQVRMLVLVHDRLVLMHGHGSLLEPDGPILSSRWVEGKRRWTPSLADPS